MAKKTSKVAAIKHKKAERTNIPTASTADFLEDADREDLSLDLFLDPTLSPQLAWVGKNNDDVLSINAPVIYRQEHIAAKMLIEGLRSATKTKRQEQGEENYELFEGASDELTHRERVEFYRHKHPWQNRMIFGDSLQVMTSLMIREGLRGQVQCIYIDPPYGIKFSSNWQVSTQKKEVKDTRDNLTAAPETIRAFRDTWENGIHSYLDYWHDRFLVAKDLLKESGSIFVQISDVNSHRLRCLLDEVFGAENFISQISLRKKSPLGDTNFPDVLDYILWYCKDKSKVKYNRIFKKKFFGQGTPFSFVKNERGLVKSMTREQRINQNISANEKVFRMSMLSSVGYTRTCMFDFEFYGKNYQCGKKSWRTHKDGIERLIKADRIIAPSTVPCFVAFYDDFKVQIINNLWDDISSETQPIYVVQTAVRPIERCLLMASDPGDLVFDPTCGSGTTAFAAEKWGRRWITCDTSRVALALARTRIMTANYSYYKLQDKDDISRGFEYKRVPHITLKDIANNEDIDKIWEQYDKRLSALRTKLGHSEDWQVPRESSENPSENPSITDYNTIRKQRQAAIDASISANTQFETLYDQPIEDKSCLRVSGPFTIESLSAPLPRVLEAQPDPTHEQYTTNLIAQLQKAGVENSQKKWRIVFVRPIERYPNALLSAVGYYQAEDSEKRAAICFGPQYATVNHDLIQQAAREAIQGLGHDILIVCGAAFASDLGDKVGYYDKFDQLPVLLSKMHPDVFNPNNPLKSKKGQSDNLFMVFGEPDISTKVTDGRVVVTVNGIDVYDPNRNEVRSRGTDEIACWFIDTDYAGECFFVRHAYFNDVGNNPYKQLRKALRCEISEKAWEALCQTESRSFSLPRSGRIAVKVINHYGDEVTKTFALS